MTQPHFVITTTMEKEDYKKFLYTATFRRNKFIYLIIGLIALAGVYKTRYTLGDFNFLKYFSCWLFFVVIAIGAILLRVEIKNKKRLKHDKTGTFGSKSTLSFYDEKIGFENQAFNSKGELEYKSVHKLMESKDYFIFYLTNTQATLLRKKDMYNVDEFRDFIKPKFKGKYRKI